MDYQYLATLASHSAIGINSNLVKRAEKKDYLDIETLSKELDKISKKRLDPMSFLMFTNAIWPNKSDWVGKKEEDVYIQINLLSKDLGCFEEFSMKKQGELMDACVDLSNILSAYVIGIGST